MKSLSKRRKEANVPTAQCGDLLRSDREFVDSQVDEFLETLLLRADGDEDRFTDMLAHFVAIWVAPCLAATHTMLRLPKPSIESGTRSVRFTVAGDANFVGDLTEFESDLAGAVTNAVLQTVLSPSPRISVSNSIELPEEVYLN